MLVELRDEGIGVGDNRVARLMRQAGLVGASCRKCCLTTRRDKHAQPAPDLVRPAFGNSGIPQPNVDPVQKHLVAREGTVWVRLRALRVARTIADLADEGAVSALRLAEALQYRAYEARRTAIG